MTQKEATNKGPPGGVEERAGEDVEGVPDSSPGCPGHPERAVPGEMDG